MNAKRVNSAAGVILAALQQNRTAAGVALSLESAQLLMTPETAAELERLRARVAELEQVIAEAPASYVLMERAQASADRLTAPTQALRVEAKQPGACDSCGTLPERWCPDCAACEKGCFGGFDGNSCSHANAPWSVRVLREDPHDGPLHRDWRLGRDLPETGGAL